MQFRVYKIWSRLADKLDYKQRQDKECYVLKNLSVIFTLLKIFYKTADTLQQLQMLKIDTPVFVKAMISKDSDEKTWEGSGFAGLKVKSLVAEFSKVGLFNTFKTDENIFSCVKNYTGSVGFFSCSDGQTPWTPNLLFVEYRNDKLSKKIIKMPTVIRFDMKWVTIKDLYHKKFIITPKEDEFAKVSLTDILIYQQEKARCSELRKEIRKMEYFWSDYTREDTEILQKNEFILRYSRGHRDSYQNRFIVLSYRSSDGNLFHKLMKVSNLFSMKHFQMKMEDSVRSFEYSEKKRIRKELKKIE